MEWWQKFFEGDWVDVHAGFWTPQQSTEQTDLIESCLDDEPGAKVLDVPCGEGRITVRLAERGYRVTGVDQSSALLDLARESAVETGVSIGWEQRDMRDLPWNGEFDAAVCWWGSFGYFDDDGNQDFLSAVARALRPGGRFVLDLHTVETILPVFEPRGWQRVGDRLVLEERQWDHTTGHIRSTWTFVTGGYTTSKEVSIRLYTYAQVVDMVTSAGFREVRGIDPETRLDFELGARRLVLIAAK